MKNEINSRTQGEDQNTALANNMGLIHYSVRHYALAVRFFQQALTYDGIATKDVAAAGYPLFAVGATRRSDILYNLGIGLLYLQRPKEAFECLLITLNKHHNNARLWLRLAEACIMVHNQVGKTKIRTELDSGRRPTSFTNFNATITGKSR
jgi:CCR4-NOT transcription complex subunit 10